MSSSRRFDRHPVSIPATVRVAGRSYRDVITNLSRGGLYLQAETEQLRAGMKVHITFSIHVGERLIPLEVDGEVARIEKDVRRRVKGLGVSFVGLKPVVQETLLAYLDSRETGAPFTPVALAAMPRTEASPSAGATPKPPATAKARRHFDLPAEAPDLPPDPPQDTERSATVPTLVRDSQGGLSPGGLESDSLVDEALDAEEDTDPEHSPYSDPEDDPEPLA